MNWMEVNRKKIIDWLTLNIFELKKKSQYYSVRWLIKWFCVGFCFVAVAELTIPNFIQLQSILLSFFFVILKYLKHQVINYQTFFFYLHFFQYRLVVICWDSIGCRVLFAYLLFFLLLATRSNGTTWAYSNNKMNSAKYGESIIYIFASIVVWFLGGEHWPAFCSHFRCITLYREQNRVISPCLRIIVSLRI